MPEKYLRASKSAAVKFAWSSVRAVLVKSDSTVTSAANGKMLGDISRFDLKRLAKADQKLSGTLNLYGRRHNKNFCSSGKAAVRHAYDNRTTTTRQQYSTYGCCGDRRPRRHIVLRKEPRLSLVSASRSGRGGGRGSSGSAYCSCSGWGRGVIPILGCCKTVVLLKHPTKR